MSIRVPFGSEPLPQIVAMCRPSVPVAGVIYAHWTITMLPWQYMNRSYTVLLLQGSSKLYYKPNPFDTDVHPGSAYSDTVT